ncbi:Histidine kinase [Mucilaginibacter lappiensis]|uniref:Histidine kinase n=1 Tax=Mucilaginibacter lappiensis TaxID=354630 RepID=A0ABR6PQS7_9SPHI|nr:histidine kinase [Mucilaginibacter lappiensis]MBB6111554.1 hypothetical protein [Mucilaginibacter lappiensis]SIR81356.1 Histidine kinase [Mucilaginibacter lappiensis]
MKKRTLVLITWFVFAVNLMSATFAQTSNTNKFGNAFCFDFISTDQRMMVRQSETFRAADTAVSDVMEYKEGHYFNSQDETPRSPIMLGVKLNPNLEDFFSNPVKSLSKEYSSYIIKDSSAAILIALGIDKSNIKNYRYHVVENDSVEIVPWSKIPKLEQKYGAEQSYGFLGNYRFPGKMVMIEVVNIKDYNIRDGVVFDWRVNFKPVVTQITIETPDDGKSGNDSTKKIYYFNLNYSKMNKGYATRFDPKTGLPLNFKFPVDSITNIRLAYKQHADVPYVIYLTKNIKGKIDTNEIGWYHLENYYVLASKYFNQPGSYEIIIQRAEDLGHWSESQLLRIPFEVLPAPPDKKAAITFKQTLPYIIATLTGVALLFGLYYRRNQVKLLKAAQEKQTAGLKLRSIRAQLNPHFMFNALTSIQNLVNKNDIAGANHYLSKFAGLTRQVLDTGNDELLSLEQELKILDDYLQMEQLRFGFQYEIIADDGLNIANIDIPAMLLQPFVENAVKHGVASLQADGKIEVRIMKEVKDILLTVKDNGKGFAINRQDEKESYGLKLSEERVALLNQLYKEQAVSLDIDTQATGTAVNIRLSNWV